MSGYYPDPSKILIVLVIVSAQLQVQCPGNISLGAIFILRKDIGVGGWSKKWQFSLTLCSENVYVGRWVVQKSLKTPLRNIKMAP